MIRIEIGRCGVDILPIVKGLVSEAEKVREAYGRHDAYAAALGIEEIIALKRREEIKDIQELSEIDMVYVHHLSGFGEIESPTPAYCELIDLCSKDSIDVIPLDMNNVEFTEMYVKTVTALEFVKEHRLAKKGMKRRFDMSSAESFAISWDDYLNKVKGYGKVSRKREEYIASQIVDIARYRRSLLAVVEVERINNIVEHIKSDKP
jgi:nitrogen regulatory protein PII